MTDHQHENWQLQESPDGGRYCAACGHIVPTIPAIAAEIGREFYGDIGGEGLDGVLAERVEKAMNVARAQAFKEVANRLTIAEPQAALNWMADQARIALGEEPYRSWP